MSPNKKSNTYHTLFHWHSFRMKLIFEGIGIGILTGLLIVLYRFALEEVSTILKFIYQLIDTNRILVLPWLIAIILIGYSIGILVKRNPMISGSGIPQIEGVLFKKLEMNSLKVIIGKFAGGILAIGSGLSLGREGPSVQLGAAVGQAFSKFFKRIKVEEKYLITGGASAGLSASFNAPLAGVMFSLEEVHRNFSPLILITALAASLSAHFVSSIFFGLDPVFHFEELMVLPLKYYGFIIILGVLVGVLGVIFNKVLLKTQELYQRQFWLPKEMRIIFPLLISVGLAFVLPEVLNGGHHLIMSLMEQEFLVLVLIILLLVKFLFTMVCYGSGAPGGIFLPLLAIGALIGSIYAMGLVKFLNINSVYMNNFIILAMAGYFTAVVRAPITGIILITEMTGSFSHLGSLSIISIVAYVVADFLAVDPIYESLQERYLHSQGVKEHYGSEKNKAVLEFPVHIGSQLDGKLVKDIKWPSHCLLVAVKRGGNELLPKGDTIILGGDYLTILTNENRVAKINDSVNKMTGSE
jgi:H+/Cl- antiporter ClcA